MHRDVRLSARPERLFSNPLDGENDAYDINHMENPVLLEHARLALLSLTEMLNSDKRLFSLRT